MPPKHSSRRNAFILFLVFCVNFIVSSPAFLSRELAKCGSRNETKLYDEELGQAFMWMDIKSSSKVCRNAIILWHHYHTGRRKRKSKKTPIYIVTVLVNSISVLGSLGGCKSRWEHFCHIQERKFHSHTLLDCLLCALLFWPSFLPHGYDNDDDTSHSTRCFVCFGCLSVSRERKWTLLMVNENEK